MKAALAAVSLVMAWPTAVWAQEHADHETGAHEEPDHDNGGKAEHEHVETHDFKDNPIHVDGYVHEKPDGPEAGATGGGASGNGGGKAGSGKSVPVRPEVTVTLGPTSYKVRPEAALDMQQLLDQYRQQSGWSLPKVLTAIASALYMFNLVNLDSSVPAYDAALKLVNPESAEQIAAALSATDGMSAAIRVSFLREIDVRLLSAARYNAAEFKMWQALRDIIMNPERYQGGGIKYEKSTRQIQLRPEQGARYLNFDGSHFAPSDVAPLRLLVSEMLSYGPSRDAILQTDMLAGLANGSPYMLFLRRARSRD